MKDKTKNRIWLIIGSSFGTGMIVWGIVQKFLYPVEGPINMASFAYIIAGGFLIFMAWFSRNFIDSD